MKLSASEGECYVCCEVDDVRTDLCACTDRPLHVRCQRQLLATTSSDGKCTVCRTHFKNATLSVERRENPQWWALQLVVGASYAALAICGAFLLLRAASMSDMHSDPSCYRTPTVPDENNPTLVIYKNTCSALQFFATSDDSAVLAIISLACCACGVVCLLAKRLLDAKPRVLVSREWRMT